MASPDVRAWRKAERARLIAARERLDPAALERLRQRIDAHLERSFPGLAAATVAFCWPMRGEYDARGLVARLRERGAVIALPVVAGAGQPLLFREWHPGVALAAGPLGIPYPVDSRQVAPTVALIPVNGWDDQGHRLGYGSAYFDRTLPSLPRRPVAIGVGYEMTRIRTIRPQPWDVPMDWIVTERGVYRRDPGGLAFLGEPAASAASVLASPVCYAEEAAPEYFGKADE
jgi:5,10-methenyltetrahydrofolate synthetase